MNFKSDPCTSILPLALWADGRCFTAESTCVDRKQKTVFFRTDPEERWWRTLSLSLSSLLCDNYFVMNMEFSNCICLELCSFLSVTHYLTIYLHLSIYTYIHVSFSLSLSLSRAHLHCATRETCSTISHQQNIATRWGWNTWSQVDTTLRISLHKPQDLNPSRCPSMKSTTWTKRQSLNFGLQKSAESSLTPSTLRRFEEFFCALKRFPWRWWNMRSNTSRNWWRRASDSKI